MKATILTYLKFWAKAFVFLTSTVLHELTHYIAVKLVGGRVTKFSIVPHLIDDFKNKRSPGELYGHVSFYPKIQAFNFIPGLAPIFLWYVLWFVLKNFGIVDASENTFRINFERLFDPALIWVWFLSVQLFRGGFPSTVDIRLAWSSFFSVSGVILMGLAISSYVFWDQLAPYWDIVVEVWYDYILPVWDNYVLFYWNNYIFPHFLNLLDSLEI